MTTPSKILIALSIVAVLLGAITLVFAKGWPRIAAIDVEFLMIK